MYAYTSVNIDDEAITDMNEQDYRIECSRVSYSIFGKLKGIMSELETEFLRLERLSHQVNYHVISKA